ncbi:hypothetical protein, partial [Sinomicrobium sp. M5D2P9]
NGMNGTPPATPAGTDRFSKLCLSSEDRGTHPKRISFPYPPVSVPTEKHSVSFRFKGRKTVI